MVLVNVAAPGLKERHTALSLWGADANLHIYFATAREGEQAIEFTRAEGRIAIGMQGMFSCYRADSERAAILGPVYNPR